MTIVGRETPQHFMRKRFGKNCEMSWLSNDLEIPIMTITSSPAMESGNTLFLICRRLETAMHDPEVKKMYKACVASSSS
jgi:hypothetical protein